MIVRLQTLTRSSLPPPVGEVARAERRGCAGIDTGAPCATPHPEPSPHGGGATALRRADTSVMRILVTNDDGINAHGLEGLRGDRARSCPTTSG